MKHRAARKRRPYICFLFLVGMGLLFVGTEAVGAKRGELVERVAAVVNDHVILLSEVRTRMAPFMAQLAQMPDENARRQRAKQVESQALEQIIGEELIAQQARTLRLAVSDRDLDLAVKDVMQKNGLTDETLAAALSREGQTIESYRQTILRPQLLRMRVLQVQVRPRVSVTEDELRALYQKNLRKLGVETQVRLRDIVRIIPPAASPSVVEDQEALITDLARRIKEGEDFAKLAAEYSEDSLTKENGGDLGYVGSGKLPLAIERIAFDLEPGSVSEPIRTEDGFHLIKVEDRKESAARPFDDVKEQLRQQLFAEKMEKATQSWLVELRKKSYIDIKL